MFRGKRAQDAHPLKSKNVSNTNSSSCWSKSCFIFLTCFPAHFMTNFCLPLYSSGYLLSSKRKLQVYWLGLGTCYYIQHPFKLVQLVLINLFCDDTYILIQFIRNICKKSPLSGPSFLIDTPNSKTPWVIILFSSTSLCIFCSWKGNGRLLMIINLNEKMFSEIWMANLL